MSRTAFSSGLAGTSVRAVGVLGLALAGMGVIHCGKGRDGSAAANSGSPSAAAPPAAVGPVSAEGASTSPTEAASPMQGRPLGTVTQASITVTDGLPESIVERIVRQNFGRFRLCYESGLRTNPGLAGRVAVKFFIDHAGAVSASSDSGSTLPDQDVVSCITRALGNITFPQPEASTVTVVYTMSLVRRTGS